MISRKAFAAYHSQRHICIAYRNFKCTALPSSIATAHAEPSLLRRLATEFGVELADNIVVANTPTGLGLVCTKHSSQHLQQQQTTPHHHHRQPQQQRKAPHQLLIRVPFDLVLSCTIPGCSPAARAAPELQQLLTDPSASWALKLAGLLLWACQPAAAAQSAPSEHLQCRERQFWCRYATVLPPSDRQTSLLLFEEENLVQLQV